MRQIEYLWSKGLNAKLFNPLLEDKILVWSKLKYIAEDILKCI